MPKLVKEVTLDREYISQILISLGAAKMSFSPPMTDEARLAGDVLLELSDVIRMVSACSTRDIIIRRSDDEKEPATK